LPRGNRREDRALEIRTNILKIGGWLRWKNDRTIRRIGMIKTIKRYEQFILDPNLKTENEVDYVLFSLYWNILPPKVPLSERDIYFGEKYKFQLSRSPLNGFRPPSVCLFYYSRSLEKDQFFQTAKL
jgi:hypothetical protein